MGILLTLLVAVVVGFIAYIIAKAVPFTSQYAEAIALIIAVLVFLSRYGAGF